MEEDRREGDEQEIWWEDTVKMVEEAQKEMIDKDGNYVPLWKRIEPHFPGEVIHLKIHFPESIDTMIERVNPWSSTRIRAPAEAMFLNWKNREFKSENRVDDWNALNEEMRNLIHSAAVDSSDEGVPLIGGVEARPNFGEGKPEFADVVFLNDELKKSDMNNGTFHHDWSFFQYAKDHLVANGVDSSRMFVMPIIPIHTDGKGGEDAIKKVFWPMTMIRLKILRPRYVIAFTANSSQPVFEKFNTEAKVDRVFRKNVEYPIDFLGINFTLIRLVSRFEMSKEDFSANERQSFNEQLYQIAQALKPKTEAPKRKIEGKEVFAMMMNAAKKQNTKDEALPKSHPSATWELENRAHVSGSMNEVAQEALMRKNVTLFVNIDSISVPQNALKKYNASTFRVEMKKMNEARYAELLEKVRNVFAQKKRIAIYSENRNHGAAILASLIADIEGISAEEAVDRAKATRKTPLSAGELFCKKK